MSTPSVMTRLVIESPINSWARFSGTGPTPGISQTSPASSEPRPQGGQRDAQGDERLGI